MNAEVFQLKNTLLGMVELIKLIYNQTLTPLGHTEVDTIVLVFPSD